MSRARYEEQFLDYIEGALSEAQCAEFERALAEDRSLAKSLAEYRAVLEAEQRLAKVEITARPMMAERIMSAIEDSECSKVFSLGFLRRLYMELTRNQRLVVGSLATCATLILAVTLTFKAAPHLKLASENPATTDEGPVVAKPVESRVPVNEKASEKLPDVSATLAPLNAITANIPAAFRALTLEVPQTSGIEGHAQPGTRVDVVLTHKDEKGNLVSSVIAQDARVLSAGSHQSTKPGSTTTGVTLDVGAADALKIQTAKQLGQLQLMLRGTNDTAKSPSVIRTDELSSVEKRSMGNRPVTGRMKMAGREYSVLADGQLSALPAQSDAERFVPPAPCCIVPLQPPQPMPQAYNSTEEYTHYDENPRISTAEQATSTFSIDVDTGSYTNARRYLEKGNLPPADAVRIEEFINYFDYSYPHQTSEPFTLSYEIAPSPLEQDRYFLKLGIKARDAEERRTGWNLVFLIDTSGSMMPSNRLELVKRALHVLVERMRSEDRVGIVTYAGTSGVALEPTSVSEKSKILSVIDGLGAGGSTYGSGGITAAYELAGRMKREGAVNRVILATDGDFNVGVTSNDELYRLIEEKRRSGITLTTIGVGDDNLKDGRLEQLADRGNGNYFFLDSLKEARKVMETDIAKNMEVVAKDVKLQIEFNPRYVSQYRLVGYDNRRLKNEDFANDKVDAGEIGSGHTVTAIYEVVLADSELAKKLNTESRYQKPAATPMVLKDEHPEELAFLKVRFKEPEADSSKLIEFPIKAADVRAAGKTSSDFRFAAAVAYFGEKLRQSQFAGSYSWDDIVKLAQAARGEDPYGYRQEFIELVKNAGASRR